MGYVLRMSRERLRKAVVRWGPTGDVDYATQQEDTRSKTILIKRQSYRVNVERFIYFIMHSTHINYYAYENVPFKNHNLPLC